MGKGGMLSAQKKLLEATVAEPGAQLQQQELTSLIGFIKFFGLHPSS